MTKQEILAVAKPILSNTEMVRAVLDGRKTVTRRVMKPQPWCDCPRDCGCTLWDNGKVNASCPEHCITVPNPPYQPSDILYVRETWNADWCDHVMYKADGGNAQAAGYATEPKWRPSIHMPKEAARIFLRVTDVRAERLQELNGSDIEKEGIKTGITHFKSPFNNFGNKYRFQEAVKEFSSLWDRTIKTADLPLYGWETNPWVWVIEFERVTIESN